jgi:sulfur transfer complex TusBCD TusB component (DsrH family)
MGEEFYCLLKLISGEEILSLIMIDETEDDTFIVLQDPVILKLLTNQYGTHIKIKPWIEFSTDDFFIITLNKVITMTEIKDKKLIDLYNSYLRDSSDTTDIHNDSNKITSKMGYLGSVEEARKNLEKIFKGLKET